MFRKLRGGEGIAAGLTRVVICFFLVVSGVMGGEVENRNLIKNGDFTAADGWEMDKAAIVPRPDNPGKQCVKLERGASLRQSVTVEAGNVYRIGCRAAGGAHCIRTMFYDASGKVIPGRGYSEDTRGDYYFPFAAASSGWVQNTQRLLAPKEAAQLRMAILPTAKADRPLYLTEFEVVKDALVKDTKIVTAGIVFQESFEGFPEVEANGGRFRPGITRVDFVPGYKGNAARFSSQSGIYYSLKGVMDRFDEGSVELYAKIEWPRIPLDPYHAMPLFATTPFRFKGETDRLELEFRSKSIFFCISGAGQGHFIYNTPELQGWRHLAFSWRANQGRKGMDFAKLYLDGKLIYKISHIPIAFIPDHPERIGFIVGDGPEGCICLIDELKIYNIAKEYATQDME